VGKTKRLTMIRISLIGALSSLIAQASFVSSEADGASRLPRQLEDHLKHEYTRTVLSALQARRSLASHWGAKLTTRSMESGDG